MLYVRNVILLSPIDGSLHGGKVIVPISAQLETKAPIWRNARSPDHGGVLLNSVLGSWAQEEVKIEETTDRDVAHHSTGPHLKLCTQ